MTADAWLFGTFFVGAMFLSGIATHRRTKNDAPRPAAGYWTIVVVGTCLLGLIFGTATMLPFRIGESMMISGDVAIVTAAAYIYRWMYIHVMF